MTVLNANVKTSQGPLNIKGLEKITISDGNTSANPYIAICDNGKGRVVAGKCDSNTGNVSSGGIQPTFSMPVVVMDALSKIMKLDGNPDDLSFEDISKCKKEYLESLGFKNVNMSQLQSSGVLEFTVDNYESCGGGQKTVRIDLETPTEAKTREANESAKQAEQVRKNIEALNNNLSNFGLDKYYEVTNVDDKYYTVKFKQNVKKEDFLRDFGLKEENLKTSHDEYEKGKSIRIQKEIYKPSKRPSLFDSIAHSVMDMWK